MIRYYVLDERGEAVPAPSWRDGVRMIEDHERRRVARTQVGVADVSTVFLGLDHRFGDGPPLVFETMVFNDPRYDGYQERYSTRKEALDGHERVCTAVREGKPLD